MAEPDCFHRLLAILSSPCQKSPELLPLPVAQQLWAGVPGAGWQGSSPLWIHSPLCSLLVMRVAVGLREHRRAAWLAGEAPPQSPYCSFSTPAPPAGRRVGHGPKPRKVPRRQVLQPSVLQRTQGEHLLSLLARKSCRERLAPWASWLRKYDVGRRGYGRNLNEGI